MNRSADKARSVWNEYCVYSSLNCIRRDTESCSGTSISSADLSQIRYGVFNGICMLYVVVLGQELNPLVSFQIIKCRYIRHPVGIREVIHAYHKIIDFVLCQLSHFLTLANRTMPPRRGMRLAG